MNRFFTRCGSVVVASVIVFLIPGAAMAQNASPVAKIAIIVGPSTHPPGTHEVAAGGRLMAYCLEHMDNLKNVKAEVFTDWPQEPAVLNDVQTIVFTGDIFPPQRLPETKTILNQLDGQMKRGCGIVCVHYATGLRDEDVARDGEHPLLHWMGGYFATRCMHHQSIAKIYPAASIVPAAPNHPISRGWKSFTLHDEPYINNYFGQDGNKLSSNVTALATSQLPPESPRSEIVAWCVERADKGRGFGIVMPHFYKNWSVEDLRRFILNGIVWTAKLDVPSDGVQTTVSDLAQFKPESVEPKPRVPVKK
jgi:type 1 glutamine amidotransferase